MGGQEMAGALVRSRLWTIWLAPLIQGFSGESTLRVIVIAVFFSLISGLLGFGTYAVASGGMGDFKVAWTWQYTPAVIVAAEPAFVGTRYGHSFYLRLAAPTGGGAVVTGNTILPITREKSWSKPFQPPAPGERIDAYLDPRDPTRMIAAESLSGRWVMLAILPLFAGAFAFAAMVPACCVFVLLRRFQRRLGRG